MVHPQDKTNTKHKFFRKKPVRELLPLQPIESVLVDAWWIVQAGYITEDDVKLCNSEEKTVIDRIIDHGTTLPAGELDFRLVHSLYRKGLVYLDVPIADDDCIIVPPLEGFVMNRVLGDYFETLLYKIFVSIDEHTTVAELANVLQIDLQLVKNAVSMYCRLGFARRKNQDLNTEDHHPSWKNVPTPTTVSKKPTQDQLLIDWSTTLTETPLEPDGQLSPDNTMLDTNGDTSALISVGHSKRVAFLFDSTLTAFLMMGNLSPGLKSHAVTMFEVGKLSDESLESFLAELEKVESVAEGEAQRYFDHAITLRDTIRFLRYNKELAVDPDFATTGQGIDLLRCESLLGLEPATCSRVLNKNYSLLVSMAPLSNEIRPISSCTPQHIGPAIPEVNSVWFKLFMYHLTASGPPSLLLVKGTRLRNLPKVFQEYDKLLVTTWGHDPGVIPTSNILLTLNDALSHSAILVQGHGWHQIEGETYFVPFPLIKHDKSEHSSPGFEDHSAIRKLSDRLDLKHTCGYVTLLRTGKPSQNHYTKPRLKYPFSGAPEVHQKQPTPTITKPQSDPHNNLKQRGVNPFNTDLAPTMTQSPKNGIRDTVSAEVLASELDSLEEAMEEAGSRWGGQGQQKEEPRSVVSPSREKMTLALTTTSGRSPVVQTGGGGFTDDRSVENDWVMLDCCFGIPLFHADVNRQVCERVASQGLCSKDSLQELLHSSRKLSLQLLNFIAEHQDLPVLQEQSYDSGMLPQTTTMADQSVPLPTHNLLFMNGVLSAWDGR